MKRSFTLPATVAAVMMLAGCSSKTAVSESGEQTETKSLVVYYSQTGTTKAVAEELQKTLGSDIESIEVKKPYDGDYGMTIQRVGEEKASGILPEVLPIKHNISDYDVVFLGFPIWYGTYAPPIASFIKANNLDNIKIVPFCTFGSGGLESAIDSLKANIPNAEIASGYGVRSARIDAMPEELDRFLICEGYKNGECEVLEDFSFQRPVSKEETAIFEVATSGYMFPLGSPVTFGSRKCNKGTEYMFVSKSASPSGEESYTSVLVIAPSDTTLAPVFTRVIR